MRIKLAALLIVVQVGSIARADAPVATPLEVAIPSASSSSIDRQVSTVDQLMQLAAQLEEAGLSAEAAELCAISVRVKQKADAELVIKQARLKELEAEIKLVREEVAALKGASPPQVLLSVQLLELAAKDLETLSIGWNSLPLQSAAGTQPLRVERYLGSATGLVLLAEIDKLVEAKLAKRLAEPKLITQVGHPAIFHSGGEFPVPVKDADGTRSRSFRPFGTELTATPWLADDYAWELDISFAHSNCDLTHAREIEGLFVPGLTSRKVNTRVGLEAGQAFIATLPMPDANRDSDKETIEHSHLLVVVSIEGCPNPSP